MEATYEVSLNGKKILATGTATAWLAAEELVKECGGGIPSIVPVGTDAEKSKATAELEASDDTFKPEPAPKAISSVELTSRLPTGWTIGADGSWSSPFSGFNPCVEEPKPTPAPLPVSDFGKGKQVLDDAAKTRIESLHSALIKGGVEVNAKEQLYATGTRLASVGYQTQAHRKAEHDRALPISEAINQLVSQVQAEGRRDLEVSAVRIADGLELDKGEIKVLGFQVNEQGLRGIFGRLESPAGSGRISISKQLQPTASVCP
jgi:hypothetical protein